MRILLLLRHAEAARAADGGSDFSRPLSPRGRRDAAAVGRFLADVAPPDHILASSAVRATQTAEIVRDAGGWSVQIHTSDRLYLPQPAAVLDAVRALPDDARCALIVGHEPAWSGTAAELTGGSRVSMPTASLAHVLLPIVRWTDAASGIGTLESLISPLALAARSASGRPNG